MSDAEKRTAYLVTRGEFSDYRVLGVFSSRALAEAFVAHVDAAEPHERAKPVVEEYEMDVPVSRLGGYTTQIRPDGALQYASPYDPLLDTTTPPARVGPPGWAGVFFLGFGQTLEHARRSAEELRRQTLALPALDTGG